MSVSGLKLFRVDVSGLLGTGMMVEDLKSLPGLLTC